jgi:hypothetical protein
VEYKAGNDQPPEKHAEFIRWLIDTTVSALKSAEGGSHQLRAAIQGYVKTASSADLELEEIENILGVDEPCIMDLAELSEADEEIVIDTFEQFTNI